MKRNGSGNNSGEGNMEEKRRAEKCVVGWPHFLYFLHKNQYFHLCRGIFIWTLVSSYIIYTLIQSCRCLIGQIATCDSWSDILFNRCYSEQHSIGET